MKPLTYSFLQNGNEKNSDGYFYKTDMNDIYLILKEYRNNRSYIFQIYKL